MEPLGSGTKRKVFGFLEIVEAIFRGVLKGWRPDVFLQAHASSPSSFGLPSAHVYYHVYQRYDHMPKGHVPPLHRAFPTAKEGSKTYFLLLSKPKTITCRFYV